MHRFYLRIWRSTVLIGAFVSISLAGCGKSEVSQLRTGDPAEAAASVFKQCDGNQDGKLAADELAASPALVEGLTRIDANRDGAVDLAEMTARFTAHDAMSDVVGIQLNVTAKGKPLDGAVVTLTLEPFMGEGKQSYAGTTANGSVQLEGAEMHMKGLPTGYFTAHIVHQASGVDVKRGIEIADDTPSPNRLVIDVAAAASNGRRP